MKINGRHYEIFRHYVESRILRNIDSKAIEAEYRDSGMSPERLRWTLFFASKVKFGDGVGLSGDIVIEGGVKDSHIDSAMKRIMRENGLDWASR